VKSDGVAEAIESSTSFDTTRWSVVRSCVAGEGSKHEAQAALSQLCRIYWRPVFSFICRRGYSVPDAQDVTQDFFLMVLNGNLLHYADPARGRFRSLLLKSLQNFLIDQDAKRRAEKRGGQVDFVSWDDWMAEAPSEFSVPAHVLENWPAERLYDWRWAATVTEEALRHLAGECERCGRRRVFEMLSGCLTAERSDISYDQLADSLGTTIVTVKRLVHQLRLRYRALVRHEIAKTVKNPSDIEDEIRYLCAALAVAQE
jgi:RNA polymerase sigma-70 factor (ECF subfamily)